MAHPPNFRDAVRGELRRGFLFRSASPHLATPEEVDTLRHHGIATFVDLRSDQERATFGDGAVEALGIRTVRAPLFDALPTELARAQAEMARPGWAPGDLYVEQLQRAGDRVARAVGAIAASPGPCLVTCAGGRDRTGLVVAATLLVAEAVADDIVADYVATDLEMDRIGERLLAGPVPAAMRALMAPRDGADRVLRCEARHMHDVIAWLDGQGGAAAYLVAHGLPTTAVARLRTQLAPVAAS